MSESSREDPPPVAPEREHLQKVLAWAVPQMEPLDQFFITTLGLVYGPRGRTLWPHRRSPTQADLITAHRSALVGMADECHGAMIATGALPTGWQPDQPSLYSLWCQYVVWHETTLTDVLHEKWPGSRRLTAIGVYVKALRDAGMLPTLSTGDHLNGVVRQGRRKGRVRELGPDPESSLRSDDVLGEMVAADTPATMIMARDEQGRPILAPNYAAIFDRMARNRRGEPLPLSLDQPRPGSDPDQENSDPPDPRDSANPRALAEQAEAARLLRDLRDACQRRGPAEEAAYFHVVEKQSRRTAGERFGVTSKQIRHAEGWLRSRLGAISHRLGAS